METLTSILLGIGLSAATGFRIFVPFLVASIAAITGYLPLSPSFEWIGTYPALILFGAATILEIAAYYIPWLDNLLDSIATPAAFVAGAILMVAVVSGLPPLAKWALAIIAGSGAAGIVQTGTTIDKISFHDNNGRTCKSDCFHCGSRFIFWIVFACYFVTSDLWISNHCLFVLDRKQSN